MKVVLVAAMLCLAAVHADALDYPHNSANNISCESCHFVYGGEEVLLVLPEWVNHVPDTIDDTQFNTLCWSCHTETLSGPLFMETHSSRVLDNGYGDWAVECRVCHNPHKQQFRSENHGAEAYILQGTVAGVGTDTLTASGVSWATDEYAGYVVVPNIAENKYNYQVLSNDSDTLTVKGTIDQSRVTATDTFGISYGKLVYDTIYLDKIIDETPIPPVTRSGTKTVKFFNNEGANSFADGDLTLDGICEACHQQTNHFRNYDPVTGEPLYDRLHANMNYPAGTDCTFCHKHENGFIGMGDGAHTTHVVADNGPRLWCGDCHGENTPPVLADGLDLANTNVCDNCHIGTSGLDPDAIADAKNYWHENPGTWVSTDGQESFCGSCHDLTPGNSKQDGTGFDAPNAAGNKIDYGFFETGHGRPTASGNFENLSWQETTAGNGNPAANRSCSDCHDLTSQHFNKSMIKSVYGTAGGNQLTITFRGPVYTESTPSGNLVDTDFDYVDASGDGAASIVSVLHTAGSSTAVITLNANLIANDIGNDTLAANSDEVFDGFGDPSDTGALTVSDIDVPSMRLRTGFENDSSNSNCRQCHYSGGVADNGPEWYTSYTDYSNSAHGTAIGSLKCTDCHDVHGAAAGQSATVQYPGMTKANQETLCYQCHKDPASGGVQNFGVSGYTGSHDGGNNQTGVMTDSTANFPTLNVTLVGWKIYNLIDGSSGTITVHDATTITAVLSGGTENDWDNGDNYHIALVDDIQQAFSYGEQHNLGTSFDRNGVPYTLECISCHNVHIVTGKHWDIEQGKSPVTRFTNNTSVWGDEAGEKMDDFAAQGSGTGGWYYNIARGYTLGATGLPYNQPAAYRPPKTGSGYRSEFDGDVLPDYATFCLDCHTYRMSAANPPVNWGQGIGCTDNSVDPPDQRIECGADHGLGAAGMPGYISDSGTTGSWGAGGNPDVLFDMNNVTRGRHSGHFMRWPYDSADRSSGINFVMSCTDCHEAHGASGPSMLRPVVNNGTPGTGTWNTFCNGCHYYYGGQHNSCGDGNDPCSCATASCHETTSIHRIIHVTDSGAGTQLMLTASGDESNYQRPDFTPEMVSIEGHIGSTDLTVTFDDGVWSNIDLSGSLDKDDFWLFDVNDNNPRTIESVVHASGSSTATITMSELMTEADLSTDTIAMQPASAWQWYLGGYVNAATGTIGAQAVSGGPWPVTITGPPPFNIQSLLYGGVQLKLNGIISDSNQIYVTFAEGAYSDTGGNLQAGDFVLDCGGRVILSVNHTAGDSFAILTLNTIVDQSEVGVCRVAAAYDSIFDSYGNPAGNVAVILALPPEASVNDLVLRWNFNEGLGTVADSNGALGTQEDMHGVLTRNVQWAASTKPGTAAGDNVVKLDRVSDRGAVQLNYPINPDDGFPPATYNNGGAPVIVQEMQQTGEFSFSVWIKPTALGCDEGKALGLNNKLRRDVLTTQFWIKNWALGIMRFSDDGDPINGNCTDEDSTHDVLRFWVAVGDPADMRCDAWGGSWPEYVHPVSPAGYIQGTTLMPTDQPTCDTSATPILPTNIQAHSFAQTETSASGALTYGGVALQPGVWQHVVGKWDGRYIRIYIDAQLAAETDMGGPGNYIMVADPHLWGGDLLGDGTLNRHVSSGFGVGARPIWSSSGSPSGGAVYWNANGYYDLNAYTYVGELDDVKYWKTALPLSTIQY